ncbi:MAG: DnaA regulatory inactivator Hda [Hahellaceae bacterium]|jgi:DnaA family protein|nr:DnaA regulatory inactivator Hda [Hahellaceae bacterium]MCP5213212.1 DnaA regulatory inactivator Hda [Hahellaceae bacterium]
MNTTESPAYVQLTLNIKLRDSSTFDNYLGDLNAAKVRMLQAALSQKLQSKSVSSATAAAAELFYFVAGSKGVGKTHVLQAACHETEKLGGRAFYLSLNDIQYLSPEVLSGCVDFDLVCIDDIEFVVEKKAWEVAIFNAFNEIKTQGKALLVSGEQSPVHLPFTLPDLKSRLCSGVTIALSEAPDDLKSEIIRTRGKLRGIELSEDVMTYIMKRSGRGMADLVNILQKLDDVSLSAKRRLTVPFIKDTFGW